MAGKHRISNTLPMWGNQRSHSMRATRRAFLPNMQMKRVYVPEIDAFVRVKVTAGELRTIDKIGLVEYLRRRGQTLKQVM